MIKNLVYTEEMKRILDRRESSSRKYETLGRKYTAFFSLEGLHKTDYFTELSTNEREFLLNTNEREFLTHYDT